MNPRESILLALTSTYDGDAWHGTPVRRLVDGISEARSKSRSGDAHSIAELVAHIAAWMEIVERRLRGIAFDPSPSEDYPDVTGTPWEELVRRLDRAHQSVLTRVDLLTEADLDRNVAGKSYSVAFMLNGLAQHTTYHAGQIALLKKII